MDQTDFFKCLSDPTRLDILKIVIAKQNVCVCELTEQLELSQPKISRHLALLRNLSILLDQRQGQWVYYRLNPNLPEWANSVLNIISIQNDEMINTNKVNSSISIHCE
ncbi:arsenic resistance transcriptional regulator [Acinetobacter guillouiae]|uniref:ArsR/SmtB family transcription factor n=1 Tax=Acinetobacter guillouiae TaxID=106649 RepID=UPI0004EF5D41|nr:metalloregulator ArsR/SmtB family transcription factor [Acinetobacter guillouiae]BAP37716.1 arsenic resistance transcriptional regulator [Acinetobacter guillouiae]